MWSRGVPVAMLAVVALIGANVLVSDAQVSPNVIEAAIPKTVHLITPVGTTMDHLVGESGCSGSFVTSFGLILTNAHCVRAHDDELAKIGIPRGHLYNPEGVSIVEMNFPDRIKPVPVLVAQRLVDSPTIDVALLKVVALLGRDRPGPLPADFSVPFMRIADSDTIRIGDPIAVLGFPGIGGDSITVTQGHVTGFIADDENNKTWLKHDAPTGHGASGGPIINTRGEQTAVTSGGKVDPQSVFASYRSVLTNRIPMPWARYFQGGVPGAHQSPTPQPVPRTPQPPSPRPAPEPPQPGVGVVIRGRVVDAGSGAGIAGAVVGIFRPGTSPHTAQEADVLAMAQTDGNGMFQTRPPVPKGAMYPVAVAARGYQPAFGNLKVPADAAHVIVVNQPIQLQGE